MVSIMNKRCNTLPGKAQNYHQVTLTSGERIEENLPTTDISYWPWNWISHYCYKKKKKKVIMTMAFFFLYISDKMQVGLSLAASYTGWVSLKHCHKNNTNRDFVPQFASGWLKKKQQQKTHPHVSPYGALGKNTNRHSR